MVAVEHKHSWLVSCLHSLDQISGKFIHFVYQVHIVFPGVALALILHAADYDLRILQHFFRRVLSVSLHADRKYKVLPFRSIHGVHDIRYKDIVRRPSFRRCLEDIHEFLTRVVIEAHVVEYLGAAVKIAAVIVERFRPISKRRKRGRGAFQRIRLGIRLIRIFSRSEETHAHPCQHLELCIGGSGANGRHFEIPGAILTEQLPQVGDRVFRETEPFYFRRVKERLQLHKHDIWQFIRRTPGLTLCKLSAAADLIHCLLAVTGGLIDPCIEQAGGKAVGESIVLISKGDISEIVGNDPLIDSHIREGDAGPKRNRHAAQGDDPVHLPLKLPAPSPHRDDPEHKRYHADDDHDQFKCIKVIPCKLQGI